MDDKRRYMLEKRREQSEAQLKKISKERGLTRADILKKIVSTPRPYTVRGPR